MPSSTTARPGESEALDVLAHILGRGSNSRLYQTLVVEKGVAVNAGASYDGTALDNTRLSVYATPKPETTLPQLEEAIDAVLADVVENGVSGDELERSKNRLIADVDLRQRQSAHLGAMVRLLAGNRRDGRAGPHLARPHPAVSAEAVRDAARHWLDKRRSVTGYLVKDTRPEEKRS